MVTLWNEALKHPKVDGSCRYASLHPHNFTFKTLSIYGKYLTDTH